MSDRLTAAREHLARAPGKRIRARLVLAAARCCGGDTAAAAAARTAEAVELIHSYSLVHDDLPAMDNDAMRRGQPTLHVAFDEATAILVGDGLQAQAFELIARDAALSAEQRVTAIAALAAASGFDGMVGGQSLDMEATDRRLNIEELRDMHALKTGALIRCALELGGIVALASTREREQLSQLGDCIGLAFQVVDDILDVESDSATLGKTQGKDAASNKATYVSLLGLQGAREEVEKLREQAHSILKPWGETADELHGLVALIIDRSH